MKNLFAQAIYDYLGCHRDTEIRNSDNVMYVYDAKWKAGDGLEDGRTYLTSNENYKEVSFAVKNNQNNEIVHICIDGGIIPFGKRCPDYIGDGKPHGRPDCMLFSDEQLLFVELKMEISTEEDKRLWRNCSKALSQLQDFLCNYLFPQFEIHQDNIENYYPFGKYQSVVCMENTPRIGGNRNSQRLNEKEKFRIATHMKVDVMTSFEF